MAFLNPILLLGILGVSVPIVIHLLNRRRVERVWWGAMRFIRAAVERNQRKLRVEDRLLLLVRCLVVGLLALALARPSVRQGVGGVAGVFGQARVTAVVAVDVSGSMSGTDGVRTRLEVAKEAAGRLVETLPGGSRVAVWAVSDTVRPVLTEPTSDMNLVRRTIDELKPSDRATNLMPAVRQAVTLFAREQAAGGSGTRSELYVVTDGQRQGFSEMGAMTSLLSGTDGGTHGEVRATFVTVGKEAPGNLGVSDLRASTGLVAAGRPVRYVATVTNFGVTEARDVRVLLRVNAEVGGNVAPVDEAVIGVLPAGQSRAVSLTARFATPGPHTVRAEIPADRMPADDARTVVTRAVEAVRVLIVDGNPGPEPRAAQSFYLRQALVPVSGDEAVRWFVRAETIGAVEVGGKKLDDYDAVILAGVADVAPVTADALAQYLARGGGVLFFPGPDTRPDLINRELFEKRPLLPAALGAARGELGAEKPALTLSPRDLEHPVAAVWKDPGAGNLASVSVFRWYPLTPGKAGAGGEGAPRVVLSFSDGSPAVMERTVGEGRVLMFASTASTQWNDLAVRPGVFVPLLYRSLGAVVGRQDEALNVRVGGSFSYRPGGEWLGRDVQVYAPGDDRARPTPDVRPVELGDGVPRLTYDRLDLAGVYLARTVEAGTVEAGTVESGSVGSGSVGAASVTFAAAPDPAESAPALLGPADRAELAKAATVVEYVDAGSLAPVTRGRAGTELWWPLAVLVLLLAAAETGMAWWFSKPK